jgi:hypothetical protein
LGTILKNLPERTILIGHIGKGTKRYLPADQHDNTGGRKKVYGERIATPGQIRQSPAYPWQVVEAWGAGKRHGFNIKPEFYKRKFSGSKLNFLLQNDENRQYTAVLSGLIPTKPGFRRPIGQILPYC